MSRLNLHISGPQGCGKGTQSQLIAKKFHLALISAGDLFRQRASFSDELGIELKATLDHGELVPIELHQQIITEAIKQNKNQVGFIFDGVIRNKEQSDNLEKIWPEVNLDQPWLIVLTISDEEAIKRISTRRICTNCGAIAIANNPNSEMLCPHCRNRMTQRSDDTEEAVRRRLEIYHTQTEPIYNYYQQRGRLIIIDGTPDIQTVNQSILKALEDKKILSDVYNQKSF